jgi:hypothetical protein
MSTGEARGTDINATGFNVMGNACSCALKINSPKQHVNILMIFTDLKIKEIGQ